MFAIVLSVHPNNIHGQLNSRNQPNSSAGATGAGTVAFVRFRGIVDGSGTLDLAQTVAADSTGTPHTVVEQDGSYTVTVPTAVGLNSSSTIVYRPISPLLIAQTILILSLTLYVLRRRNA